VILGTAPHMSPEQARGRKVDKRTDIWAFGCVLYEMLAGKPAFMADDVIGRLAAVVKDAPDWNALPSATPPALRRLLQRLLDKDPRRRVRDIGDARAELDALDTSQVGPTFRSGARGWSRWKVGATVLAAAALGALAVLLRLPRRAAESGGVLYFARSLRCENPRTSRNPQEPAGT